jgi:uncharacterized protein (TIGR01777 family)
MLKRLLNQDIPHNQHNAVIQNLYYQIRLNKKLKPLNKGTVLIAGGSGFIGKHLYMALYKAGYNVYILSRNKKLCTRKDFIFWNPDKGEINLESSMTFDGIINLCGAGIASKKWSSERKKELIQSRTIPAAFLSQLITEGKLNTTVYIGASAIGIYGHRPGKSPCLESDDIQSAAFLSDCCQQWESAHIDVSSTIRKVIIRVGLVLATSGGLLEQYKPLLSLRVAPYFGGGNPMMSWIEVNDLCQMFLFALENKQVEGIYNGVADNPVNSKTFASALIKTSGKKGITRRIPNFAIKWMMGEMSALMLESQHVSNQKIKKAGFRFVHKEIFETLRGMKEEQ